MILGGVSTRRCRPAGAAPRAGGRRCPSAGSAARAAASPRPGSRRPRPGQQRLEGRGQFLGLAVGRGDQQHRRPAPPRSVAAASAAAISGRIGGGAVRSSALTVRERASPMASEMVGSVDEKIDESRKGHRNNLQLPADIRSPSSQRRDPQRALQSTRLARAQPEWDGSSMSNPSSPTTRRGSVKTPSISVHTVIDGSADRPPSSGRRRRTSNRDRFRTRSNRRVDGDSTSTASDGRAGRSRHRSARRFDRSGCPVAPQCRRPAPHRTVPGSPGTRPGTRPRAGIASRNDAR